MAVILPFKRDAVSVPAVRMPEAVQPPARDMTKDDANWAALMLRAQDGDKAAYRTLLLAITPYVRAIARRYLGAGEDVEDAVQEVLMVVHGIRHTFERGRPFKPWLGTIASRRCIDLLRRRSHRARHELADVVDADGHVHAGPGPEDALLRDQQARRVRSAVDELPTRQRDAVSMLRLQELSLKEASAHSKQTVGALKVACHRAIGSLQRTLGRKKDSPHD
ncbi:MAG: sigma-70 family RNA polymerase sigma factor [Thermomonas sp.]